ncbi:hypothetical protein ACQP1V_31795 [Microtetraspora malaysiensis]|uniref:hypothetical protein n=1 Tax=Microtetraspora malaysiensis TaxID=161358 RepID=UPI003D938AA9
MRSESSSVHRAVAQIYQELVEAREHFCYTITMPILLAEAVRCIGMHEADLLPAAGHDTLEEEGCLLIGQVGPTVVTFDEAGIGRFLRGDAALAKGRHRGVVQWDFYDKMFSYIDPSGNGGSWDEDVRVRDKSIDMIGLLRDSSLSAYAGLFESGLWAEEADDAEAGAPYLETVMLAVLESETGLRFDEHVIDSLPYALHIPENLR